MKFKTEEKKEYTFVRVREGKFVTGSTSGGDLLEVGNTIEDVSFCAIRFPRETDVDDAGNPKQRAAVMFLDMGEEHVLTLSGLMVCQVMQNLGAKMLLKAYTKKRKNAPANQKQYFNQLFVESDFNGPDTEFKYFEEDGSIDWEATILSLFNRLFGGSIQGALPKFERGAWVYFSLEDVKEKPEDKEKIGEYTGDVPDKVEEYKGSDATVETVKKKMEAGGNVEQSDDDEGDQVAAWDL